jgi:hypothetical protein
MYDADSAPVVSLIILAATRLLFSLISWVASAHFASEGRTLWLKRLFAQIVI